MTQLDRSWRLKLDDCRAHVDAASATPRSRRRWSANGGTIRRAPSSRPRGFAQQLDRMRRVPKICAVRSSAPSRRDGESWRRCWTKRAWANASRRRLPAARAAAERSTRAAEGLRLARTSRRDRRSSRLDGRVAVGAGAFARERIQDIERAVADTVDAVAEQLGGFKTTIEGRVEVMDAKAEGCRERAEFATRCADHASAVSADAEVTAGKRPKKRPRRWEPPRSNSAR